MFIKAGSHGPHRSQHCMHHLGGGTSVSMQRCLHADNTILNYLHSIKIVYPVSGGIRASLPYILIPLGTVSR